MLFAAYLREAQYFDKGTDRVLHFYFETEYRLKYVSDGLYSEKKMLMLCIYLHIHSVAYRSIGTPPVIINTAVFETLRSAGSTHKEGTLRCGVTTDGTRGPVRTSEKN